MLLNMVMHIHYEYHRNMQKAHSIRIMILRFIILEIIFVRNHRIL
jgi:hypothetical protein